MTSFTGTVIQNGNDLLMAFAKLDENGRGNLTYDEYLDCLEVRVSWGQAPGDSSSSNSRVLISE